jgi:V-type H+-transporting ATPase subunit C
LRIGAGTELFTTYFQLNYANTPKTNSKLAKKAKSNLDSAYSYLGGNAFGRDSKGRIKKDDSATSTDMQATGHMGEGEYSAYVYYEFEIN